MSQEKVDPRPEEATQAEVLRPKRVVISEEEAVRRMEEFPAERKENLIAAVRKNKD
jgi:hypothetical protein